MPPRPSMTLFATLRQLLSSQRTPVATGGYPFPEPWISLLPSTTHWLGTIAALAAQWTPFGFEALPSPPPRMTRLESITGWQAPIERTPSTRVLTFTPAAPTAKLSTI